jgi:hypothetical protein
MGGFVMPKHTDLDFDHAPQACDDCWEQRLFGQYVAELTRSNQIRERELDLLEYGGAERPRARPPTYVVPPPPPPQMINKMRWGQKGGMNIEPS